MIEKSDFKVDWGNEAIKISRQIKALYPRANTTFRGKNLKIHKIKVLSSDEIKNEKLSINFWSTSGMMASYYEILNVMSTWLIKKGIKRSDAQKYITN